MMENHPEGSCPDGTTAQARRSEFVADGHALLRNVAICDNAWCLRFDLNCVPLARCVLLAVKNCSMFNIQLTLHSNVLQY